MPIVAPKVAQAAPCVRKWVKGLIAPDGQLLALGLQGFHKDRLPQPVNYIAGRHFVQVDEDQFAQNRGVTQTGVWVDLLVSFHSDKPDDDVTLAGMFSRARQKLEGATGSNEYGSIQGCFFVREWAPPVDEIEGDEGSAVGAWFRVRVRRARL